VRWQDRAYLTLFLVLALTTWRGMATAGEQPDHDAKNQMHHPKEWRFTLRGEDFL